mmetsp:Transcript_79144/g.149293  ORF Transcript_79144/g.149293 Transcript_79144/m.149293 type:complete len:207 (+) Transcript_79144:502-1122(+)
MLLLQLSTPHLPPLVSMPLQWYLPQLRPHLSSLLQLRRHPKIHPKLNLLQELALLLLHPLRNLRKRHHLNLQSTPPLQGALRPCRATQALRLRHCHLAPAWLLLHPLPNLRKRHHLNLQSTPPLQGALRPCRATQALRLRHCHLAPAWHVSLPLKGEPPLSAEELAALRGPALACNWHQKPCHTSPGHQTGQRMPQSKEGGSSTKA